MFSMLSSAVRLVPFAYPSSVRRLSSSALLGLGCVVLGCSDVSDTTPSSSEGGSSQADPSAFAVSSMQELDPPSGPGAMAANWQVLPKVSGNSPADGILPALSWLEPFEQDGVRGHRFLTSTLDGETWSPPVEIHSGAGFFANWADLPGTVAALDGSRSAHWLQKVADGTYAYGIHRARLDENGSWQATGWLHEDLSATEHGFASYVPLENGDIQAFWLDGREMVGVEHGSSAPSADDHGGHGGGDHEGEDHGGTMQLRTRILSGGDGDNGDEQVLAPKVCECCATDAALTSQGPLVVYRARSDEEIRDIHVIRHTDQGWTSPSVIHQDGWRIEGCPVNGPAVVADGDFVAVTWFTAEPQARVFIAFSDDAGASFSEPLVVDDQWPMGRVDLVLSGPPSATIAARSTTVAPRNVMVAWMGTTEDGAEIRWRVMGPDKIGDTQIAVPTNPERSAGVTRIFKQQTPNGDRLLFAWIENGEERRLRVGSVSLAETAGTTP